METTKDLEKYTYDLLAERGVTLDDIAIVAQMGRSACLLNSGM